LQGPGSAAVVQLLLEAGADVNARTASDASAMHIAACSNSGDVIRALVKAGGNARDNRAYKGGWRTGPAATAATAAIALVLAALAG
jgi:ankyrin repeat protein